MEMALKKRTAAILDENFDEDLNEIDNAIVSATPQELERLERLQASGTSEAMPQQPVNSAGLTFSGCNFSFSA